MGARWQGCRAPRSGPCAALEVWERLRHGSSSPYGGFLFLGKVEELSSQLPPEVPAAQIKRASGKRGEDKGKEGRGANSAAFHFNLTEINIEMLSFLPAQESLSMRMDKWIERVNGGMNENKYQYYIDSMGKCHIFLASRIMTH